MSRCKQQPGGLVIALIGAVFTAWNLSPINNQTDEAQLLPLHSVLRRDKDVFASNAAGLYRAELSRKTWKRLPTPDSMPLNGNFADQPTNSKFVLYYASREPKTETANAKTEVHGLYISQDDGQTW